MAFGQKFLQMIIESRLQNRTRRLIECPRHKDGWVCDWLNVCSLMKYDRLITTYKVKMDYVQRASKIHSLLGGIFRYITQERLMISKFLSFTLNTVKSLLETREQVPGTRSQNSKYLERDPKTNNKFRFIELL